MRELRRSCAGERDAEELYQGAVRQAADIAMTSRKSVVLVTVDCLRADHVGFMGYDRPTTPFLDLLAAESFVVPAAVVAVVHHTNSIPFFFSSSYAHVHNMITHIHI